VFQTDFYVLKDYSGKIFVYHGAARKKSGVLKSFKFARRIIPTLKEAGKLISRKKSAVLRE